MELNKGHRSNSSYALSTALIYASTVAPKVFSNVGQKGQVPGPLDSHGQTPLVLGTGSCPTARPDLASIGEKAAQKIGSLVVYDIHFVCAKGAHLATGDEPPSLATMAPPTPMTPCPLFVVPILFVRQIYLPMYNDPVPWWEQREPTALKRKLVAFESSSTFSSLFTSLGALALSQHDHLISDQFGAVMLLPVLILPTTGLQAAFDIDLLASG
jgi:hypothetical protein